MEKKKKKKKKKKTKRKREVENLLDRRKPARAHLLSKNTCTVPVPVDLGSTGKNKNLPTCSLENPPLWLGPL